LLALATYRQLLERRSPNGILQMNGHSK